MLVAGIVIASVCGYMAGLMGASNSPISGIGILAILAAALLLGWLFGGGGDEQQKALVAYALFTTAIVFGIATISNDNLQDLKTGQLVGATPWRQQVALVYRRDLRVAGDPAHPQPARRCTMASPASRGRGRRRSPRRRRV